MTEENPDRFFFCSGVTTAWTGSSINRWCTYVVPWNNYCRQVIRNARTHIYTQIHTHTHTHTCIMNWCLMGQNYHAWEIRWAVQTCGSRFWHEYFYLWCSDIITHTHTHTHRGCAARHVPSWSPTLSLVPTDMKVSVGICQSPFINELIEEHDAS
jgi:hypothetical protein